MPPKKQTQRGLFSLALFGLVLSPASLIAQNSPYSADQAVDETEETYVLPTFTVESETVDRYRAADAVSAVRIRTQMIETPATISVLTKDFIEDVAPVRILDATRYSAGVQAGYHQAFAETMTMRGFSTAWKTVDNFLETSGYLMEPALIERIEISKGPNAILAPGITPGGHVNIVTKVPEFKRSSSIEGIFGEWDANKFSFDTTGPLDDSGRFAYRLIGVYQDTRRYWSKDFERSRKVIAPSLTWRINPTTELVLRYNYRNTTESHSAHAILDPSVNQRGQKPILAPGFSYRSMNGTPKWAVLNYAGGTASAQLSSSFNRHITMRLAVFADRTGEDSATTRPTLPGLADTNTPYTGNDRYDPYTGYLTQDYVWSRQDPSLPYDEVTNPYVSTFSPYYDPTNIQMEGRDITAWRKTRVVQNDWVFNFELPIAKLQTVTGWAYTHTTAEYRARIGAMAPYSLYDLENQDQSVTWGNTFADDEQSRSRNAQIFLNQRISFWEDKIAVAGGILWYETMNSSTNTTAPDTYLSDDKEMYMGSVLYRITPQASVYYSYSTNSVPTSANGVSMWSDGKQHEYGVKSEFFNRRLSLNLAYFEITQTNVTSANPDFQGGDTSAPRTLVSDQKNHGFEIELNGALTRNLSAVGSFSQVKMSDQWGRDVRFVSKNLAALLLSYRIHEGTLSGLSATLGAVYTGEFAGDVPSLVLTPLGHVVQPSFYIPSYTLVNAGLGYDWGRYQVRLYVDNLADKKNYIQTGGARYGFEGLFSGAGRLFKLSATVKF